MGKYSKPLEFPATGIGMNLTLPVAKITTSNFMLIVMFHLLEEYFIITMTGGNVRMIRYVECNTVNQFNLVAIKFCVF